MDLRHINKYGMVLAASLGLWLTSCSDSDTLDQGSNTIRFAAKVQGSTEDGGSQPAIGQKVSVLANGKTYAYTLLADGSMTAQGQALTWDGEDFDVKAWTPATDRAIDLTDQTSAEKLSACDLLAADARATSHYVFLGFKHQMVRMLWDFASIDASYTQEQIDAARVFFIGYGSANFNRGVVTTEGSADKRISTCETQTGKRQGEAIMAPADMWNKALIKIEIGGDEYTFTPDKANAADLATAAGDLVAGRSQRYHITIARKTLSVRMEASEAEWNDNREFGTDDIADAKLTADIDAEVTGLPGYTVSGIDNRYILDRTAGFTITYTENALGGLTWTGNCRVTRTEIPVEGNRTSTTHTYTFTDIKGDITVSYLAGVEEGDYLYDNGTWGKEETREGCKAIGRVFHAGLSDKDDSSYGLGKVRGYAAPLLWGNTTEYKWFTNQADERYLQALADIPVSADADTRASYYGGHRLTALLDAALEPFSADWQEQIPLWHAFKSNSLPAPASTSGWYIPTIAQLKDLFATGLFNYTGTYLSSQVYAGTGNAGVFGIEDGDKTTLWAIRCADNRTETYGWAIDAAKLLPVITF